MVSNFKTHLAGAKTRAVERATEALAVGYKPVNTNEDGMNQMCELRILTKALTKCEEDVKKYHRDWEILIDQLKSSDSLKADNEQGKLDEELSAESGLIAIYQQLKTAKQHLSELEERVFTDTYALKASRSSPTSQVDAMAAAVSVELVNTPAPPESSINGSGMSREVTPNPETRPPRHVAFSEQPSPTLGPSHVPPYGTPYSSAPFNAGYYGQALQPIYGPQTLLPASSAFQSFSFPRIEIPKFDGNPRNFRHFWQVFEMYHNDPRATKMQKMVLLQNHLTGKAADYFKGYDLSDLNYDTIIDQLHKHFGRNEQIIQALHAEFMNIHPRNDSLDETRRIVNNMESILKQLEIMNVNVEDGTLRFTYSNRIPKSLLARIHHMGIPNSFKELRERVQTFILVESEIYENQRSKQNVHAIVPFPRSSSSEKSQTKSKAVQLKCLFCGKHKGTSACRTITDIQERRKLIQDKKLCFLCLKDKHVSKECRSNKVCSHCKEKQHASLCFCLQ